MKELLQYIEKDDFKGINTALKTLLEEQIQIDLSEITIFRAWIENQSLEKLGESITVRCLSLIRKFPELCGFDYLYKNFLAFCGKTDMRLNSYDTETEHIFAELLETTAVFLSFPASEEEFTENIKTIENSLKEKIKYLMNEKIKLPEKNAEYLRLFYENEEENSDNATQLLFEILLIEKELQQFLFSNVDIPLCYLIYFIALDEYGHFTPIVKQAAIYGLKNANNNYLWNKFLELRKDYFKICPVYAPIIKDVTVYELANSICKALNFLEAEHEYQTVFEISKTIFETMPDFNSFLYNYPLTITNANGDAVLTKQWTSIAFRTFLDIKDKSHTIKRITEILDYTLPDSMGLPAVLFKYKELSLPFIRREYLRFKNVDNEAEIRLRSTDDPYYPPKFVRTQNPKKARDLVSTYMTFLELYSQKDNFFESPQGNRINREDIAMFLEKHFDLSAITEDNILHAKIMLWYVEPIQSIFKISEANEETLSKINEYIESIYGSPLTIEAAKEKALEIIAQENENIEAMNRELKEVTENLWLPLQEGSYLWNKMYSILLRQYTSRNTLTIWELRGILYDMRKKRAKPFYYPFTEYIGKFFQRTVSKILKSYEKDHPNFIKARKWLYDYFYNKLDTAEKKLDVCGWKEYSGVCLRKDRNCCKIPYPNQCLTETGCNCKPLSCKFWLCTAALSRLISSKKGRRFLIKRRLYSYLCIALNIPLKIRCSKINSFDDKAKEPFVDVSLVDWFDNPLVPYAEKR